MRGASTNLNIIYIGVILAPINNAFENNFSSKKNECLELCLIFDTLNITFLHYFLSTETFLNLLLERFLYF